MSQPTVTTTQDEVLDRLILALRDGVPEFNATNCFYSLEEEPPANVQHNFFALVRPGPSQYDPAEWEGAGNNTPFEYGSVIITLHSRIKLDRRGHDQALLNDADRGLLLLKRKALIALGGVMLTNEDGEDILIAYLQPVSAGDPRRTSDKPPNGALQIQFTTDFQWDLT